MGQQLHQFILTEEENKVVAIEIPDIQSSLRECKVLRKLTRIPCTKKESNQLQPMEITTYESQEGTSVANKTQILDIGLGEEDKCSKLLPDKNTYDATTKENEDVA
ncbi:hypothetical protein H5410_060857 [Solanum commersonii]|uniref:Uncharacterized protein n=1 Tax=Solanum commersonii TaxID=4109 RepID=A0A9J5W656_SOLCO|nr:hypothetical protein H5410_060857 [Solanum commersonii]